MKASYLWPLRFRHCVTFAAAYVGGCRTSPRKSFQKGQRREEFARRIHMELAGEEANTRISHLESADMWIRQQNQWNGRAGNRILTVLHWP